MTSHLKVPLELDRRGRYATVEQDSDDDVTQSVRVLLLTEPGTRLVDPAFGVHLLFTRDLDDLADLVAEQDPRAAPVHVQAVTDQLGAAAVTVTTGGAS